MVQGLNPHQGKALIPQQQEINHCHFLHRHAEVFWCEIEKCVYNSNQRGSCKIQQKLNHFFVIFGNICVRDSLN